MNSYRPKAKPLTIALLYIFIILASLIVPIQKAYAVNNTAKVSFTFDDGLSSSILAAQTLQKYGYTGTNYIITNCVGMKANSSANNCAADATKDYMSWQDISTLHNTYGWEIGSHTVSHPLLAAADNPSMTGTTLDYEILQSQLTLKANGFDAMCFATPYGDYDNQAISVVAKYYNSFRAFQDLTYSTDTITNNFPYYSPRSSYPYNNYLLTVLPVQGDVTVAKVKSYIDQAKANNQWLILVFHEIKADNDPTYDASLDAYQYTAGNLGAIAEYVKSQSIPVVNISNGLASGTNIMPNSSFNNGIADGWTTDSPTKIIADKQTTTQSGHGSFDGTLSGPLNSVLAQGSSLDTHLFSPTVTVTAGTVYTLKNYINLLSTSGEVDFYIDEYDINGNDLKTGKYFHGITAGTDGTAVQVGNVNFIYTPSSASVASARLQVIIHGVGTLAYLDNLEWLSADGSSVVLKAGDLNGDNVVDALDLSTVLSSWNQTAKTRAQGNVDGDAAGSVDALDLSTILSNWSK